MSGDQFPAVSDFSFPTSKVAGPPSLTSSDNGAKRPEDCSDAVLWNAYSLPSVKSDWTSGNTTILFTDYKLFLREPGSSVSIVSGYGLNDRAIEVRSPTEAKGFFF
jgi:hypothetical protein